MPYQVHLKQKQPVTVARKRAHVQADQINQTISTSLHDLFVFAERSDAEPAGPPGVTYVSGFQPDHDVDLEIYLPVTSKVTGEADIEIVDLAAGPVAHTIHRGRHEDIGPAYDAIFDWMRANGYKMAGPPSEAYLTSAADVPDPSDYLTEVAMPIVHG
jgi:effector-binding domain-containing protein